MQIPIVILKKAAPDILKDVNRLIAGLSLTATRPAPLSRARFRDLLAQKKFFVLAAYDSSGKKKKIIGFLTVYLVRIPSGLTAVAEDFLVLEPFRKWGVGRMLMERALEIAEKKGARHLNLSTNPVRKEANELYKRMGFNLKKVNMYRMNLPRNQSQERRR